MPEHVEEPAADYRADDADDEVADDPAGALARHDRFGEKAGDDADDDPREYVHRSPPGAAGLDGRPFYSITLPRRPPYHSPAVSATRERVRCERRHRRRTRQLR